MNTLTRTIEFGLCALALGAGLTAQAAAPVITNFTMAGAAPQFGVHSDLGITNQVECSTNLSQPGWVVLTNLMVTESPYEFVDESAPPATQRFYRVLALASAAPPNNMALIPAGSFTMGDCLDGDSYALPLHEVYVSAFYMDRYDVTYGLWQEVCSWATNHGYIFDYVGSGKATNHPVQTIDWYNCVKWCNARSEREGRVPAYYTDAAQTVVYRAGQLNISNSWVNWSSGYRLPTEAEWEKAARGGAGGHRFPWTDADTITHSRANYNVSQSSGTNSFVYDKSPTVGYHPMFNDGVEPYTSPVGYFAANGYGLYDMAGNVRQWCWDWYGSYSSDSQTDPRGPVSGSNRVGRGGGWTGDAMVCRTADRSNRKPTYSQYHFGFRSVLPASH